MWNGSSVLIKRTLFGKGMRIMGEEKRRDNKGRLLLMGECQEKDGSYTYRYTDKFGKRRKLSIWRLTKADALRPRKNGENIWWLKH